MQSELPKAEHRKCARHIYANWAKKWRGEERKIAFWNYTRSTYPQELKSQLNILSELGEGLAQDAIEYGVESWCKAFFKTEV